MRREVRETLLGSSGKGRLETYYALLLMDGDHMGRWLSGAEDYAISYRDSFHPQVRSVFDKKSHDNRLLRAYAQQKRALSPNRHLAISGALNDFSLTLAPHVVEVEHLGRVIYTGGDDVLAMLPVADLLSAMQRLRLAYSGAAGDQQADDRKGLTLHSGFALLGGRLLRTIGDKATASAGAVIAHHQAPLSGNKEPWSKRRKRESKHGHARPH